MLWKLITAPEGVEQEVKAIKGNDRLSSKERLNIYADMYFYRIRDSLKDDYPCLLKLLGETGFHNLITSYLAKNPPTHFSLRYAGQHLPHFLKSSKQQYLFLPELAQFEWDLLTSFDAEDKPALTIEELKRNPPDKWEKLIFRTNPSVIFKKFQWPVDQIRSHLLAGKKLGIFKKKPVCLCIWRQNYKVHYRPVSDRLEQKSLFLLQKGRSFGEMCEEATDTPLSMAHLLSRWVKDGLLVKSKISLKPWVQGRQ